MSRPARRVAPSSTPALVLSILLCMLTFSCATSLPTPTSTSPKVYCAVSCPSGFAFIQQLKCRGDRRWLQDIRVVDEYTNRSPVDGTVISAYWIACADGWRPDGSCHTTEDFDKRTVVRMSCNAFRAMECTKADANCGHHPGEPDPSDPLQSPPD